MGADIASEAAEEVLEQQDRDRQFAELRVALQQAAQDGTMPAPNGKPPAPKSDNRRRGYSGGSQSDERTRPQGSAQVSKTVAGASVDSTAAAGVESAVVEVPSNIIQLESSAMFTSTA